MSWWDDWGPALPVEGGLVATGMVRGTRIAVDARGVGAEIVTRMVERVNSGLASRGRAYARGGQTVTMTIEGGRIHALIQGSGTEPYSVTIACTIPAEHRGRLIAAFEHALPDPTKGIPARGTPALREEIDACELLVGIPITARCTCPYGAVCKHCIALAYVAADRLDGSPIAIATFFGVRDEDLGVSEAEGTTDTVTAVPVFDSKRQAQLARTLARLDDRDPPTLDDVLQRAARTLTPPAAVLTQLGLDAP
jgi:Uncharacterized conserved protein